MAENVDVHLYKKFSTWHYIALTAIVKVRTGSPKTAWKEQVCVPQKSQEVNFPKYLWGFCAPDGL